ncbi:MAG: GntR family transcriptional regulator [Roseibium sp.]|uniref:GntR family transcriptional regulator n=1 Tax=Roseibium sp. TaxID=1936156 RepID=UPI0026104F95|nr:GntR family transcriptional regulator [Roseibium sp.]MCV0427845.1 GntR family transcriptional regulator [Roseibium sp.]
MNVQLAEDADLQNGSGSGGKRARKCDAVYQDLKRKILTGELTSDSLITEQSLAQDYQCSQSTIREALMLLQEFGLVDRRGYQGTFVTNPSTLEAMLLLKLRIDMETTSVIEAAKNITARQLQELRDLDQQFEECRLRRDVFGCSELDRNLHLKLFKIAEMPTLEPVLLRTTMMLQRIMLPTPRPEAAWRRQNVTSHQDILNALEKQDVQEVKNAMKAHILSSAVVLAPHFYGRDLDQLQKNFDKEPAQIAALAGL